MKNQLKNDTLYLFPEGKIDSANAEAVEKDINDTLAQNFFEKLVMDAKDLYYISSAGLRIVLRLKKSHPSFKITNVDPEVYEIFDMTGFTEMMEIEKAYKRISVEGCEVIGRGANGKVYRIDADTIVKVYENPDSLEDIRNERALAKKAFVLGIPTAISYDIARVGEGYGTVFELLNANSLSKLIMAEPEKIDEYMTLYVDLLKRIHQTKVKKGEVPEVKSSALEWAEFVKDILPKDTYDKLYAMLVAIPDADNMLHGDYHVKNVMMQDGEVLLIDMDTLCSGDPVFEFAGIYNAYVGFAKMEKVRGEFLGLNGELCELIWKKTLEKYFGTKDEKILTEYENKAKVVGYLKLLRRMLKRLKSGKEEVKEYVEYYKEKLIEVVDKADSLAFNK